MKSFGIIAACALFGAINAAPLNKRAVVWVTETNVDVVTVPVTKTVWAEAEKATATHTRHTIKPTGASATSSSSVYVAPAPSSSSSSSSSSVYVAPTLSSTSVYVAPTSTSSSVYVAPTTSSTSVYVAPTTSSTSVYVAPTSTYVAPSSTSSTAAATTSSSSSSGSSSGVAASGTSYTGDLTWYDVGLGACGLTSVETDHIVAISWKIFDNTEYETANPNSNPLCGRYVSITGKDGSAYRAKVVDRCTGCAEADLDLSEDFFNTVTDNGNGRVPDMTWVWE